MCGAVAAACLAGPASAGVPQTLTDQGRLYGNNNQAVSGPLDVTFALYDQGMAGSLLWYEMDTITFDDGYFSVELGQTTAFGSNVFDGSKRYPRNYDWQR